MDIVVCATSRVRSRSDGACGQRFMKEPTKPTKVIPYAGRAYDEDHRVHIRFTPLPEGNSDQKKQHDATNR
jgi:hypothetical protein